ncbi:MAG: 16S rRNA (cytidine(1402)-2'-O)-methyltransferase [Rhodospirillaceae bacterium]|nr:16S rRNA (cytidine(1402)-2'-O)-methyltransferase [Rhodospirillaceae bacterium]
MGSTSTGTLYVVATPIGNLDDISPRACQVLASVDLIAAEDTRRTRGLLSKFGVKTPTISYHDHNEASRSPALLKRLQGGESVALVSDAGTPLLSDPGLVLVRAAHEVGVPVVPVAGPSALAAALSVAGEPTDRFVFEGFLPRRAGPRRARLQGLARETGTVVLFESVHRIRETMAELRAQFGSDRPASILRELTKLHESVYRGTLGTLTEQLGGEISLKGEFVLVIAGAGEKVRAEDEEILRVFKLLAPEVSNRLAVTLTAKILGVSRNRVYRLTRVPPL